jgi:hypothetical protein
MALRYWRGGTGSWGFSTANWSATSGGAGGASVPNSSDDVIFDTLSAAGAYTVTIISSASCRSISFVTSSTVVPTITGTSQLSVSDADFVLPASNVVWSYTGSLSLQANTANRTINLNGLSVSCGIVFRSTGSFTYGLAGALTTSSGVSHGVGTFNTNGFNLTASAFNTNTSTGTVNLGASTITMTLAGWNWTQAGVVLNAGTSSIRMGDGATFTGGGKSYNDVQYNTANPNNTSTINGVNNFTSLTLGGTRTVGRVSTFRFSANQTIGTLTVTAGSSVSRRTRLMSNTPGTIRTLTVAALGNALGGVDLQDIAVAGASAPWSGSSLGNCQNNSGVTFPAAKTVYYSAASGDLDANVWSDTIGGTPSLSIFPLAQDTTVFVNNFPSSGGLISMSNGYSYGTVNISARTQPFTLSIVSFETEVYGNWIGSSAVTYQGNNGALRFVGRSPQTLTSVGRPFSQTIGINCLNTTLTLQDALTCFGLSFSSTALAGAQGSFNDGGYNITTTQTSGFGVGISFPHTITINGTWTFAGDTFNTNTSAATYAGNGTISFTNPLSIFFTGFSGSTYPRINLATTGTLNLAGNNTRFNGATNTANGTLGLTGGQTINFNSFALSGVSGANVTLTSTTTTNANLALASGVSANLSRVTISKISAITSGGGSFSALLSNNNIDGGNNTGIIFSGYSGNFFAFF